MEKSMDTLMDDVRELKTIIEELKEKFAIIDEIVQFNYLCEKCRTINKQIHKTYQDVPQLLSYIAY